MLAASHHVASAHHEEACHFLAEEALDLCVLRLSFSSIFSKPSLSLNTQIKPDRVKETIHLASCPASLSPLTSFMQIHVRAPLSLSLFLSRASCTRGTLVCVAVVGRNGIILARQGL